MEYVGDGDTNRPKPVSLSRVVRLLDYLSIAEKRNILMAHAANLVKKKIKTK